jgi:hypothetical protein
MTKGTTVGCMAVVAGVLLATVASVYANHAATGKGTYSVHPLVLAEFHFVVAKKAENQESGLNFVNFLQSEMAGSTGSNVFQTFMIGTSIAPLVIDTTTDDGRTVTFTGQLMSTTFIGIGSKRQSFAEIVPFTAIGVDADKETPGPAPDLFTLEVTYSEQVQGELFASLGLGKCVGTTCTITFHGEVKRGDLSVHTSGDE